MQGFNKIMPGYLHLVFILTLILIAPFSDAQQSCPTIQIPYSDKSSGVSGDLHEPILVTCDDNYEGGGVTFCRADGSYYPVQCTAYSACSLPTHASEVGNYIEGDIDLFVGDEVRTVTLHIQNKEKDANGEWTSTPLETINDEFNSCPPDKFRLAENIWQTYYYDMAVKGMPTSQLKLFHAAISGGEGSGIFLEEGLGAGGYSMSPGWIKLWPDTREGMKRFMAHENMHGWQVQRLSQQEQLDLFEIFVDYSNRVYHESVNNPENLSGSDWALTLDNYGLQTNAEFIAEVFQEWLYGCCGGNSGNWPYIDQHQSDYKAFFNCLWIDGNNLENCRSQELATVNINYPQTHPALNPPSVNGFSADSSQAIWKACFNQALSNDQQNLFDQMASTISPNMPTGTNLHYSTYLGDCNHDNTLDWMCSYVGPGPAGIGNGGYLWNNQFTEGLYSAIASGQATGNYAEIVQDPFFPDPISGYESIIQPDYRHWPGNNGACNGALHLSSFSKWGFDPIDAPIESATSCSYVQNLDNSACYSDELLLWLDTQDASTLLGENATATVNGDEIYGWKDKSLRGNDAVSFVSDSRPELIVNALNSHPAVKFEGDMMEIKNIDTSPLVNPELTSFIVMRNTDWNSQLWVPKTYDENYRFHKVLGEQANTWSISSTIMEANTANSTDTISSWLNGVQVENAVQNILTPVTPGIAFGQLFYVGSVTYYSANADIAEVIVIKSALSETQRQAIESSLAEKWQLRLESTPCGGFTCTTLFNENFDQIALDPFVSPTESGGSGNDYTRDLPSNWTRDETTTPIGNPVEFRGFSLLNKNSWIATASNQDRDQFTKASGTVLVADGDEYDDGTNIDPNAYNVYVTTSTINLNNVKANTVSLQFDSSYRHYASQNGQVQVSWDNGISWETLLTLDASNALPDLSRVNETIVLAVNNPLTSTMTLRFAYLDAGNDWWWAIDNIQVQGAYAN